MIIQTQNYTVITLIFQQNSTVSDKGHYVPLNNMVDYTSWPIILPMKVDKTNGLRGVAF
jgi:hypothetical protein